MSSEPEYVFARDYVDNNRINLQHYLWTQLFGYHVHPQIPVKEAVGDLRVVDVGTGTGIWLSDLSSQLPETSQLDGLDISFKATPPAEWLPSNLKLRRWDVREPVPEDLVEKYDFVHVRFFSFVLRNEEISEVAENIVRLIKPGGYLQWGEPDTTSLRVQKTQPNISADNLMRLAKLLQPADSRLSPTWVPKLQTILETTGLRDTLCDKRDPPAHWAMAYHECNIAMYEQLAQTTKHEGFAKHLKELLPAISEDMRKGVCWAMTMWTVVGRKADK